LPQIGVLAAVHGVVATVLEVPSGAVADAVGRRRTLLVGAVLLVLALTAFAFARDLAAFCAAEAMIAAARAAISGSLEAWFVDAVRVADPGAQLRRPLSRASAASALGLAAGALLGGVVPQIDLGLPAQGDDPLLLYSPAILLGAGLAVVYLAGVATLVRGPGSGAAGGSAQRGPAAMRAVAVAAAGSVRASVPVRLLLVAGCGLGIALTAVETLWQPRLSELLGGAAGNTTLFGVLVAASMLCVAAGAFLAPRMSMRLGGEARTLYVVAALTATAALAGLALAGAPAAFAVAFVAFYGTLGTIEPLHLELLHEEVPSEARATMLSVESLAEQLGGVTSSLTLPRLAASAGIPAAFWVSAGVMVAVALVARALPRATAR
jgi:predicted MFS family arabinose efflux permease